SRSSPTASCWPTARSTRCAEEAASCRPSSTSSAGAISLWGACRGWSPEQRAHGDRGGAGRLPRRDLAEVPHPPAADPQVAAVEAVLPQEHRQAHRHDHRRAVRPRRPGGPGLPVPGHHAVGRGGRDVPADRARPGCPDRAAVVPRPGGRLRPGRQPGPAGLGPLPSQSRASSRSGREVGGILGFLLMFAAIYAFSLGAQRIEDVDFAMLARWMPPIVEGVAWTPVGALFAVPMDLAEGRVLTALARVAIGAVTIVLVWLWWRRSIDVSLTSALTGDASSGGAKVSPLVPRLVRPGPCGAGEGAALPGARHPVSRGAGHLSRGAGVLRGDGSAAAGVPPDDAGDGDLHVRDERDQPGQRDRLRRPLRLGQHRHRGAVAGEP